MSAKPATAVTPNPKPARHAPAWAWALVPLLAAAFIAVTAQLRVRRVIEVSSHAGWSSAADPRGWRPQLVVPGNLAPSFEWLDQTRLMLDGGPLRIRHVDYENAPFGRDVRAPSPYRWYLGALAAGVHAASGRPMGACLEQASLWADPALALLLLGSVAILTWRLLGPQAAAAASVATACLYPLSAAFLPGAPDDQGLVLLSALASVLPLVGGVRDGARGPRWFAAAGIAGGLGVWIHAPTGAPLVGGIAIGGFLAAWVCRGAAAFPWRVWSGAGAATVLAAYMVEYFPSHLGSWDLRAVHPLFGVAWLGLGEALALCSARLSGGPNVSKGRTWVRASFATLAVAALPAAMAVSHSFEFLASELRLLRLDRTPVGAAGTSLAGWIMHEGVSRTVLATLLPVALGLLAGAYIAFRSGAREQRAGAAILLGTLAMAAGFACLRLSWWATSDALVVAFAAIVASELSRPTTPGLLRPAAVLIAAAVLVPGIAEGWPLADRKDPNALDEPEVIGLVERDLARWLSQRMPAPESVVLAPPNLTTALYYYGGLRGLGTLDWENQEGIQSAVRIVSATTPDEAFDLISRRTVLAIVIPSWDSNLDGFAVMGLGKLEGSFINGLHHWALPPWLRPVPYPLPVISGFEGQSVAVMQVTDDQDDALLMSRIGSYLVETDNLSLAGQAADALRKFQADLSALVARAEIQVARGQTEEFQRTVDGLVGRLSGPAEKALPWDRRLNLSVVLAQGHHLEKARMEFAKCLEQVSEDRLRSLSTASLYHFDVLVRALQMEIPDSRLRQLSVELLPPDIAVKFAQ